MLWKSGKRGDGQWGQAVDGSDSTDGVWMTVDNGGREICPPTSTDAGSSPIHRPYYNNVRIKRFFVGRQV
jgi:hypothetical protein